MSKAIVDKLKAEIGDSVTVETFRGDDRAHVPLNEWVRAATFLRDAGMDFFGDLTAVDWPERTPEIPRFELVLYVRSSETGKRAFVTTDVAEGSKAPSLTKVWAGANWAEREVYDMFGVEFSGHDDMRRILLYEEFEGYPLRKDYPIDRAQPLVEYRQVDGLTKFPPFGIEEGQPFARIDWQERLAGRDAQVSPAIALQSGQTRALSDSGAAERQAAELAAQPEPVDETAETTEPA